MKQLLEKFGIDDNADLITIHGELLKLQFLYTEALKNSEEERKQEIMDNLRELSQALATITILIENVEHSHQCDYDFEESENAFLTTDYTDLFGIFEGMSREEMEEQIVTCSEHCENMMESESEQVREKAQHLYETLSEAKGLMQVSKAFITEEQLYHVMLAYLSLAAIKGVDRSKMNMLFMGAIQKNLECIKTIGNLCFINKTYKVNANCWLELAAKSGLVDSYFLYGNALAADKNIEEAVKWYDLYAASGRTFTMEEKSALGMAYLLAKEYTKGLPLVQEATDAGFANSMIGLGALYECGEIVDKSLEKALSLYENAKKKMEVEGNNTDAVNRAIDRVRIAIADENSGFDWMSLPLKDLFHISPNATDKMIYDKVALVQNTYEKLSLISDNRKSEKAKRICRLGTEIKNILVQQNLPEIEGGKMKYIDTIIEIYDVLYNREGFPMIVKQFREALTGNVESLENTGFVCFFGFKDEKRAKEWIEAACKLGSKTARLKFAVALQKNEDYEGALYWFQEAEMAGELSSPELVYSYGICAFRANHRELAARNVQAAASAGYRAAILTLGAFYEDGCGIAKDYQKSKEYYEKAKELGVKDADKYLNFLEQKMTAAKAKDMQESIQRSAARSAKAMEAVNIVTPVKEEKESVETREEILNSVKKHYDLHAAETEEQPKKLFSFANLFKKKKKDEKNSENPVTEM